VVWCPLDVTSNILRGKWLWIHLVLKISTCTDFRYIFCPAPSHHKVLQFHSWDWGIESTVAMYVGPFLASILSPPVFWSAQYFSENKAWWFCLDVWTLEVCFPHPSAILSSISIATGGQLWSDQTAEPFGFNYFLFFLVISPSKQQHILAYNY